MCRYLHLRYFIFKIFIGSVKIFVVKDITMICISCICSQNVRSFFPKITIKYIYVYICADIKQLKCAKTTYHKENGEFCDDRKVCPYYQLFLVLTSLSPIICFLSNFS